MEKQSSVAVNAGMNIDASIIIMDETTSKRVTIYFALFLLMGLFAGAAIMGSYMMSKFNTEAVQQITNARNETKSWQLVASNCLLGNQTNPTLIILTPNDFKFNRTILKGTIR